MEHFAIVFDNVIVLHIDKKKMVQYFDKSTVYVFEIILFFIFNFTLTIKNECNITIAKHKNEC